MPELPEVQTIVDTLAPILIGRRLRRVIHLRRDIVTPVDVDLIGLLTDRCVRGIARRGKRINFELDDGNRWFVHLGMTGRLTIDRADTALRPHTHLIVDCGRDEQLRFVDPRRFGGIFWLGIERDDNMLGPEPLAIRPSQLLARLKTTRRAIKGALLDQKFIAGLGNIYADEALFAARIHPLLRTDQFDAEQARRLNAAIKRVLRRAIRHRGSSLRDYVDANGRRGDFQQLHRVYDRAGKACRVCGTAIERIILAQRSTHFCPSCQEPPTN